MLDTMTAIFRDDRFPGVEVHNFGRCTFHIRDCKTGQTIETFTRTMDDATGYEVSPSHIYVAVGQFFADCPNAGIRELLPDAFDEAGKWAYEGERRKMILKAAVGLSYRPFKVSA